MDNPVANGGNRNAWTGLFNSDDLISGLGRLTGEVVKSLID